MNSNRNTNTTKPDPTHESKTNPSEGSQKCRKKVKYLNLLKFIKII